MSQHPIEGMMNVSMEKIKEMVDVNTIVGDPITAPDGSVAIPVSKVTYGFASGGSDFGNKKADADNLFGGGSGAGITITPVAFLTISNGNINLLPIQQYNNSVDRIIEMVPDLIEKFKKSKKKKESENVIEK